MFLKKNVGLVALVCAGKAPALVLPEDQYALAYHSYSGNHNSINATRFSWRNSPSAAISLGANYEHAQLFDDSFETSFSAKPYQEDQDSLSLHGDYLHENSLLKLSFNSSNKNDYEANRLSFDIVQENLNSLSTLSMGYSNGLDKLQAYGSTESDDIQHHKIRLGLNQVLSAHWMGQFNYEFGQDDGTLGNPYIPALLNGAFVPASYPGTRNSHAASLALVQYIDRNTAAKIHLRYFKDDWGIHAQTLTLNYAAPLRNPYWHLDSHVRFYQQSDARFYSNNANQIDTYISHDKNLSIFNDIELGLNARVDLSPWFGLDNGKVYAHLAYAMIFYAYQNYSQLPTDDTFFSFKANTLQSYITVKY